VSGEYELAKIESAILLLRGQKVMLDRDLAALYGVETRVLNQAVRRNIRRFPSDFMFELTRQEIMRISQIVTSSPGIKFSKRVHAFTEAEELIVLDTETKDCIDSARDILELGDASGERKVS
jgi:hypothetical protein